MAYWVFANKTTGHLCGLADPNLEQWPEGEWFRAQRDDLHQRQSELSDLLKVVDGQIVDKDPADRLACARRAAYITLSRAYEDYISIQRGYTPGWRSLAAEYAVVAEQVWNDPASTETQKAAVTQFRALQDSLRAWGLVVDAYYAGRGAAIWGSEYPQEETWDFSQFDASDPGITLAFHLRPLLVAMLGQN